MSFGTVCPTHGVFYTSKGCPYCSASVANPAPPSPVALAEPAEVSLQRIAVALERIADAYTATGDDD